MVDGDPSTTGGRGPAQRKSPRTSSRAFCWIGDRYRLANPATCSAADSSAYFAALAM
jgi:hypothetical protein